MLIAKLLAISSQRRPIVTEVGSSASGTRVAAEVRAPILVRTKRMVVPHVLPAVSQKVMLVKPGLKKKDGATPNIERKVRDKCAESANPAR